MLADLSSAEASGLITKARPSVPSRSEEDGVEEDQSRPKQVPTLPRPLEGLSVTDLAEYREALRSEIARVEAELSRRASVRSAAEALFGPRPRRQE